MPGGPSNRKIRVVVAKPGLDGHDRGAKIIARALRDAGMEVIYTGLHQTPEQIVETVLQEDADAVGLSILSGAHMTLVPRVVELLREQEAGDVVVTVGGTIPAQDIPELQELGVAEVFTPGAPTSAHHRLHPRRRHAVTAPTGRYSYGMPPGILLALAIAVEVAATIALARPTGSPSRCRPRSSSSATPLVLPALADPARALGRHHLRDLGRRRDRRDRGHRHPRPRRAGDGRQARARSR